MKAFRYLILICISIAVLNSYTAEKPSLKKPVVKEKVFIDKAWPGHPVGFYLLNHEQHQFAAYYNAKQVMTIASRKLGDKKWTYKNLPSKIGWDSHNNVIMTLDKKNCLHISGNMHCVPLVYFRSEKPLDISSIKKVNRMTGKDEGGGTYPKFIKDAQGNLLFMYRSGSSGNGKRFVNIYDEKTRSWKRLLNTPLLNGQKQSMNAYPIGPRKGPDGLFHLVWVWRDTPDCRTNHDISYARSKDMVHWETADGKPVKLPLTPLNKSVIVDPIPTRKGLINISYGCGFDLQNRPIVHYHNYDKKGNSQIFLARFENGVWKPRQITDWKHKWNFRGGGCISVDLSAGAVRAYGKNKLIQNWRHKKYGNGVWSLDPETLKITGEVKLQSWYPQSLKKPVSKFKRLPIRVHWRGGAGSSPGGRYFLRWETLEVNRDRPRKGPLPEPSSLELYRIELE